MFFPIMGMLVSSSLFGFNRIVEFDLDLVFCSATLTVKDWDTFDILSSSHPSLLAAGEEDTNELPARGVGYHHVLVLDPSKEVVIDD